MFSPASWKGRVLIWALPSKSWDPLWLDGSLPMSTSEPIPEVSGRGHADRLLLGHRLLLLLKSLWIPTQKPGFSGKWGCWDRTSTCPGHMPLKKTFYFLHSQGGRRQLQKQTCFLGNCLVICKVHEEKQTIVLDSGNLNVRGCLEASWLWGNKESQCRSQWPRLCSVHLKVPPRPPGTLLDYRHQPSSAGDLEWQEEPHGA